MQNQNPIKEALNECIKARLFIHHRMHVADARLVLRRAQRKLIRIRLQRRNAPERMTA